MYIYTENKHADTHTLFSFLFVCLNSNVYPAYKHLGKGNKSDPESVQEGGVWAKQGTRFTKQNI